MPQNGASRARRGMIREEAKAGSVAVLRHWLKHGRHCAGGQRGVTAGGECTCGLAEAWEAVSRAAPAAAESTPEVPEPGLPCAHPGCLSHVSHPCEGCGRRGGGLLTA